MTWNNFLLNGQNDHGQFRRNIQNFVRRIKTRGDVASCIKCLKLHIEEN